MRHCEVGKRYGGDSTLQRALRLRCNLAWRLKRIDRKHKDWHTIAVNSQKNHSEGGPERRLEMVSERHHRFTVQQPDKMKDVMQLLQDLEAVGRIAEAVSEDRSGDLGSGGTGSTGASAAGGRISLRDQAIAKLPSTSVMRTRLTSHLQSEVRQLERRAKKFARSSREGGAFLLNELYARIRKIQALMGELVELAAEVVQRLYIRLFIDHQQLV